MSRLDTLGKAAMVRLRGEMGRALIRTTVARAVAALGALGLALVIGRLYGPSGLGVYALAYSLLLGIGILARLGMDNGLVRYVGQDSGSPHVRLYLGWAVRRALLLSVLASAAVWLAREPLQAFFDAPALPEMLTGMALAGPAYTLGFLLSGFFKGVRKPATACLLENGSISLVAGGLILVASYSGWQRDIAFIGYAYAIAAWLVMVQGVLQVRFWIRHHAAHNKDPDEAPVPQQQFMASSRAFFAMGMAGFMQTVLAVMIAGWLLSSTELGLYKSAQQAAMLISFVLIVISAIFPPRFATLHHNGQQVALERLARQGALFGALIAGPLCLVCLVAPGWVLGFFGEGFDGAESLLRIIAVAQLVNVTCGSVGYLLSMTGHERLARDIALICNGLGLIGFFVLPPLYGALGAALALVFVLVSQNLVSLYFVWRRLGIWTLPGPNWMAIVRLRGG